VSAELSSERPGAPGNLPGVFEQPSVTFSGISDDPAVAAKQASASAIAKDSVNQHCAELHSWVQTAAHRVICPDNADCATKYERQNPPAISPRQPLDREPQDTLREDVCPVMLTEAGLMTEIDWRAMQRLAEAPGAGISWIGFRDCYLDYTVLTDLDQRIPHHCPPSD